MNDNRLDNQGFLTIKEAAQQFEKSEQTIRRLVKQHIGSSHVRTEKTQKGNMYLISRSFVSAQYEGSPEIQASTDEIVQLQTALAQRDLTIQQLQNRLLEQNDVLNALTSQINSQRIGHIEELLIKQNEQLGELQKRIPKPVEDGQLDQLQIHDKKSFWQRLFGK